MRMKAKLAVLSLGIAVLLCTGCKSEKVKNTEELINNIGEVTLESRDAIEAAQSSYEELGDEQSKVENLQTLQEAEKAYADVLRDKAAPIEKEIAAIPQPVTLDAEDQIVRAQFLYTTAEQPVKEAVSNMDVLDAAQKSLDDIKVQNAIDAIGEIGTVTLDSWDTIETAISAYQAVSSDRRADITNYAELTNAQSTYAAIKKEAAEAAKKAAVAKLKTEKDEVEGITWYYPTCYPKYSNTRCFVLPYIGERNGRYWLRCKVDYAADDWVFFQKIVINIDGEKRDTITFGYGDVVRDTAWGAKLYEAADFAPDSSQIRLLEDIANSEKTIIRFQGSDFHYDFTVPAKDKQGIKDVLAAFEYVDN